MLDLSLLQRPGIIFWWPYVLSALLITFFFLVFVLKKSAVVALRMMFARNVWLTRSTLNDILLSLFYGLVVAVPVTAWQITVFRAVMSYLGDGPPRQWFWSLPTPIEAITTSVYSMLWVDFATYVTHVMMHKFSILWPFHAVHHSASQLTLFTTHRQHPLEPFLLNTMRGASAAVGLAIFYWFFPQKTAPASILGVSAGFFVYMLTVNLQHSHIPVRYPAWLAWVVLSPHAHHLHHSQAPEHRGCNYGVIFSMWDRIFGTYLDQSRQELRFGLTEPEDPYQHSVLRCIIYPCIQAFAALGRGVCRWKRDTSATQHGAMHR